MALDATSGVLPKKDTSPAPFGGWLSAHRCCGFLCSFREGVDGAELELCRPLSTGGCSKKGMKRGFEETDGFISDDVDMFERGDIFSKQLINDDE